MKKGKQQRSLAETIQSRLMEKRTEVETVMSGEWTPSLEGLCSLTSRWNGKLKHILFATSDGCIVEAVCRRGCEPVCSRGCGW